MDFEKLKKCTQIYGLAVCQGKGASFFKHPKKQSQIYAFAAQKDINQCCVEWTCLMSPNFWGNNASWNSKYTVTLPEPLSYAINICYGFIAFYSTYF